MATKINARNCYLGVERATITVGDIVAGNFQNAQKQAVAASMQTAFDLYYNASQAAMNFASNKRLATGTPASVTQAIDDVRAQMGQQLRAAAATGFISRFSTGHLKWAFEHLESTGGRWTDTTFDGWHGIKMPAAIVNFMGEVDAAQGAFTTAQYNEWQSSMAIAKRLKDAGKWDELGTKIGYAKTGFETITPKLWTYLGQSASAASKAAEMGGKWLGYGAAIHNYSALYLKVRYSKDGAKAAALAEAFATVLNFVPVFGAAYGDVVRGVPGLMVWFKGYGERNRQAINGVFR